jgi:large subunit ribosomal protein L31
MREGIHPTYYTEAKVVCSCGNTWTTGSTREMLRTDVCAKCHPFYTGEQRIVDTAGQVDRFMKRLNRYSNHQSVATERQETQLAKLEERFAKQQLVALDLDDNILHILHDNNVISVGDLAKRVQNDKDSLLAFKGFGPKSLEQVETKLAQAKELYFTEA